VPDATSFPPGLRGVPRPATVQPCAECGELCGRGYPACRTCAESVDRFWLEDWRALLSAERVPPGSETERELAALVLAERVGTYPWTCTDWAMRVVDCRYCGAEQGTGEPACVGCTVASQARWAWDFAAMPATMSYNEHALRVAVAGLRATHRHRESVVTGWRLLMPFLLTGELPTNAQAQRLRAYVLAGRYTELAGRATLTDLAAAPGHPWRAGTPVG
jgi:hypothetical protein